MLFRSPSLVEEQLVKKAHQLKQVTDVAEAIEDEDIRADLKEDARVLLLWFAFAFELSSLYVEVSTQHIMPNIEKLDQLAILAGGDNALDAEDAGKKIHVHLEATQRQIKQIAERVCNCPHFFCQYMNLPTFKLSLRVMKDRY